MIILGIDPGSTRIGFGAIEKKESICYLTSGILNIKNCSDKNNNLPNIEKEMVKLIRKVRPKIIGIEKLFFVKNLKTAIEVAQARGVIISTIVKNNLKLIEMTPTEIKLSVTGNGHASKQAVAKMVRHFLGPNVFPNKCFDDVTDALAIAIAASSLNAFSK